MMEKQQSGCLSNIPIKNPEFFSYILNFIKKKTQKKNNLAASKLENTLDFLTKEKKSVAKYETELTELP